MLTALTLAQRLPFGPMTTIVLLVLLLLAGLGLLLLRRSRGPESSTTESQVCPVCRTHNPPDARYCTQCGLKLG